MERLAVNRTKKISAITRGRWRCWGWSPRVKKQHRYRTLLKARGGSARPLQTALRQARDAHGSPPNGYHIGIDVDALDLL